MGINTRRKLTASTRALGVLTVSVLSLGEFVVSTDASAHAKSSDRTVAVADISDSLPGATGKFSVIKEVYGTASPDSIPETFAVDYTCQNATGATTKQGTLNLKVGQPVDVAGVPEGTCKVTEKNASIPNADWIVDYRIYTAPNSFGEKAIPSGRRAVPSSSGSALSRGGVSTPRPKKTGASTASTSKATASTSKTANTLAEEAIPSAEFEIKANTTVGVAVSNVYHRFSGSFEVSKEVAGDAAKLAPSAFTYEYSCTNRLGAVVSKGTVNAEPGKAARVENLGGIQCTVTEKDASVAGAALDIDVSMQRLCRPPRPGGRPESVEKKLQSVGQRNLRQGRVRKSAVSLDGAGTPKEKARGTVSGPQAVLVEIDDRCTTKIKFKNTYTAQTGSFSIVKKVEGLADGAARDFAFSYECTDGSNGDVTVKANGKPAAVGKDFATGTSCTVKEKAEQAQADGYTLKAPEAKTVVIQSKDEQVQAEFVNVYEPTSSPKPTPTATTPPAPAPAPKRTTTPMPKPDPSATSAPSPTPTTSTSTPSPSGAPTATPTSGTVPSPSATPSLTPVQPKPSAGLLGPRVRDPKPMGRHVGKYAPTPATSESSRRLANTGATVVGSALTALALIAGGLLVYRRKRG